MDIERGGVRGHLIVDGFFEAKALAVAMAEVASLERQKKLTPGLVREIGHDGQSVFFPHERRQNRAVWIHEGSRTLRLFREALWAPARVAAYERAREPLFQIIPNCWAPHLQVSSYMTGDHYDFHEDEGAGVNLTAIVFLARHPKKVRGGDIVLSYDDEETVVPFRHNRLLVFPSKTLHRVTRVRVASEDPLDARISLQCWLAYGQATKSAMTSATKSKARTHAAQKKGAIADTPTFLLGEEPIIAAAQALVASADGPEQTPESLYWGAFYVSRILTANLRFVLAAQKKPVKVGALGVRQSARGLEVSAIVGKDRVGFLVRGADAPPAEALSLFVERGRGTAKSFDERTLFPGTGEEEAIALLGRLLP